MKLGSQRILAAALCALAPVSSSGMAAADTVASPLVQGNLAVFPIREATSGSDGLIPIEQAARDGLAKVYRNSGGSVVINNRSGSTVFVPMGTLFAGGTQDQVSAAGVAIPPGALATIDTYCVDPFRNTARVGEDPQAYTVSGLLVPWRPAKLSMLNNASSSAPVDDIRQSGVWWSIDTLRTRLEARLGVPLEPPALPEWTRDVSARNRAVSALAARSSAWTSSLPLALQNSQLEQAQASYMAALGKAPDGKIVGAAFAINGSIAGAEVYHDPKLATELWPQLVRAYATEALAARSSGDKQPPSIVAVKKFLASAARASGSEWTVDKTIHVRPSKVGLYAEARDSHEQWINRSYLPRLAAADASRTPDALAVDILQRGEVNGRRLSGLSNDERLSFERTGGEWSAVVSQMPSRQAPDEPSQTPSIAAQPGQIVTAPSHTAQPDQIVTAPWHTAQRQEMPTFVAPLLLAALVATMGLFWAGARLRRPGGILPRFAGAAARPARILARLRDEKPTRRDRPLIPSPFALLGALRNLAPALRRRAAQAQRREAGSIRASRRKAALS